MDCGMDGRMDKYKKRTTKIVHRMEPREIAVDGWSGDGGRDGPFIQPLVSIKQK